MGNKNGIGLVFAIVVGVIGVWIGIKVLSFIFSLGTWLLIGAAVAGVAYLGYRKFQKMLTSGKRLT